MTRYSLGFLFLPLLLAGCAGGPQPAGSYSRDESPRAELLETRWRPVEIDGKPVTIQPGAREPDIVLTRDGRVSGNTGCNLLGGVFRQSTDGLHFDKLLMTRRACAAPEADALESSFADEKSQVNDIAPWANCRTSAPV